MKKFEFVNAAAKRDFLALPEEQVDQFGSDLNAIQHNKRPWSNFKDISGSVGVGAIELIENGSPAYRVVYCAKYLDTVYILHAFVKTCKGVDGANMKTAKERYKLMMEQVRKAEKEAKYR
jgi:phage-related protein